MTALAVWFGLRTSDSLSATQAGFTVISDHKIQVVWDVVDPEHKPISCTIIAMDIDRNVVGTKSVKLARSRYESTRYHQDLLTTSRAVTGTVSACSYLNSTSSGG